MATFDRSTEPMAGSTPAKVTVQLQLLADGQTIVLTAVCSLPAIAEELFAGMAEQLKGSSLFRLADFSFRQPVAGESS
ncbi:hypothetical protein [Kaistia sp. MMO-174]|uniref:hypothetical protein n=1 Tax=Kaistia sp. MMO-174 TaxID=3081256 RepID=UPI00301A79D7